MIWAGPRYRRPPPLPRDASWRYLSEGRRLLLEALRVRTATEIADDAGVHRTTVSRLASGELVPRDWHMRVALEVVAGIPPASWDEPPRRGG